jgi:alpha-mannosidase
VRKGRLPQAGSLLTMSGGAQVTALKPAEDGKGLLVRMHPNGEGAQTVTLAPAASAALTDILETEIKPLPVRNGKTEAQLPPHTLQSVYFAIPKE